MPVSNTLIEVLPNYALVNIYSKEGVVPITEYGHVLGVATVVVAPRSFIKRAWDVLRRNGK